MTHDLPRLEPGTNRYGPTAARPLDLARRPLPAGAVTVDMHSHVAVPAAHDLVAAVLDRSTIPLVHFSTPDTAAINMRQDGERRPLMLDPERRLAEMDRFGLAHQVIMPTPFQCYYSLPDRALAREATRMVNEGVAAFRDAAPERFTALGGVVMSDPEAATAELEFVMRDVGFRGVQILTSVNGLELSDPLFEPFWAAAERLGAVVLIHPNGFTQGERLSRYYFNNVIGNPLDTTVALHYLIFDGVLERYPGLKLVAVHGGGYLPAYSGRMDHAWGARTDVRGNLPHPPTSYLRKVFFDSVVFTTEQLEALVRIVGHGQVMMGTDYPYDMAEYDPVGHVLSSNLDTAATTAILGGNARRLFDIG